MSIDVLLDNNTELLPTDTFSKEANFKYSDVYGEATRDRLLFWEKKALELTWFKTWNQTLNWNRPYAHWFVGGKLTASYNCLDTHIKNGRGTKTAIIWESEQGKTISYSYQDIYIQVNKLASQLKI